MKSWKEYDVQNPIACLLLNIVRYFGLTSQGSIMLGNKTCFLRDKRFNANRSYDPMICYGSAVATPRSASITVSAIRCTPPKTRKVIVREPSGQQSKPIGSLETQSPAANHNEAGQ